MTMISRTLAGTLAVAAIAAAAATPAQARDGALATVGVSIGHYGNDYPDRGWGNDRGNWGRGAWGRGNVRAAVDQCVRVSERTASRAAYGRADVTDIRDVRPTGRGYEVRGRIAVNASGRDWRGDYRGYGRGYDNGSFRCRVEYGRVVDIDYDGIRGL